MNEDAYSDLSMRLRIAESTLQQRLAALENAVSMLNARITVVEDLVRQRDERLDRLREAIDNLATAITR